ncbi:MAG: MATE family efflux transporter [Bacillota bacterium]|nr:MATE family efflux transporter [Bacillota bacterium]
MAEKTFKKDLTEGSVSKGLLMFALPLFASNILQVVYNLVDMVVVGQVMGKIGMSGVSIGGDIFNFITALAMGFCGAAQIIIAQNVGAKRMEDVKKIIGTLFTFLFIFGLAVMISCWLLRFKALELLQTPTESYDQAYAYTVTCIFGILFVYGYNAVSAILRGLGDSKRPFTFIAIAAIANGVLDVLFVAVFKWGAFGAALATVIGQGASFIFSIIYLYKRKESFGFDFKLSSFGISKVHFKSLISLGIPMCIQYAAINFSRIVVARWINGFGVTPSAVAGVFNKSSQIVSLFANAIFTAGGAMVGQNIGAEKYDRVQKILLTAICCMAITDLVLMGILNLFPDAIFGMFTKDLDVITAAHAIIYPLNIFMLSGIGRTPSFCLINGSGNSKLNLIIALIDGFAARIGLSYLFAFVFDMGARGCWIGDAYAGFVPLIVGVIYYLSGKWKTNKYLLKRQIGK